MPRTSFPDNLWKSPLLWADNSSGSEVIVNLIKKKHTCALIVSKLSNTGITLQCIQAKISKTLDKRSTLIFAANCTEKKTELIRKLLP